MTDKFRDRLTRMEDASYVEFKFGLERIKDGVEDLRAAMRDDPRICDTTSRWLDSMDHAAVAGLEKDLHTLHDMIVFDLVLADIKPDLYKPEALDKLREDNEYWF